MYPESATNLKNNTRLVLVPFKIIDLQWLISVATKSKVNHTYESVLSTLEFNKAKVLVYHPAFIKYVYDIWTEKHGRYPSTGFLVLIFALHVCDEVNVYGYGANSKGEWKHYWENITDSPYPSVHSGDSEYNTILKLDDIGKIKLYKGIKT
ncbi:CMP-N-acetylneuraminate-beta-galactosamide-alpha-2,3-sialyltransferase 1 isoform X2 [Amia ocellicauda]